MKVYKTGGYNKLIEVVEVKKVTEKSVWLSNRRCAKISKFERYWDTMEEAKEYLEEKYKRIIKHCEMEIEGAKCNLEALINY